MIFSEIYVSGIALWIAFGWMSCGFWYLIFLSSQLGDGRGFAISGAGLGLSLVLFTVVLTPYGTPVALMGGLAWVLSWVLSHLLVTGLRAAETEVGQTQPSTA